MLTNDQIAAEIRARRSRTEKRLGELSLPGELEGLLAHVKSVDPRAVEAYAVEIIESLPLWAPRSHGWSEDTLLAAGGFEWYYDGSSVPEAMGCGYAKVVPEPTANGPSSATLVKDDFLAGASLDQGIFGDDGGIDIERVCGPYFDLATGGDFDPEEHEEADDLVHNLFVLHLLETLHQTAPRVAESAAFRALPTPPVFYLFARNHDDLGFFFAALRRP